MSGEINTTAVTDRLLPDLHSDTYANLTFWSQAQLINFMDEAAKHLSRSSMMFVERDTSQNTAPGTPSYTLPSRHNATVHVSVGGVPMRPGTTVEMEARDQGFQTTPGTPDHWYEDDQATTAISLCPVPNFVAQLAMVCSMFPPDLDQAQLNVLLQAPAPVAIHLQYSVLAKAYGKESETEEPDLAQHCQAHVALLEQLFTHLYGEGL